MPGRFRPFLRQAEKPVSRRGGRHRRLFRRTCGRPICTGCFIISKASTTIARGTSKSFTRDRQAERALPRSAAEDPPDGRYAALGLAAGSHVLPVRRHAAAVVFPRQLLSERQLAEVRRRPGARPHRARRADSEMRGGREDPHRKRQSGGRAHLARSRTAHPERLEFRAPIVISNADALHTYANADRRRALRPLADRASEIARAELSLAS